MFVTFGILTNNKTEKVVEIIDSIEALNIPVDSYEIIVVGDVDLHEDFYQNFKIIFLITFPFGITLTTLELLSIMPPCFFINK